MGGLGQDGASREGLQASRERERGQFEVPGFPDGRQQAAPAHRRIIAARWGDAFSEAGKQGRRRRGAEVAGRVGKFKSFMFEALTFSGRQEVRWSAGC